MKKVFLTLAIVLVLGIAGFFLWSQTQNKTSSTVVGEDVSEEEIAEQESEEADEFDDHLDAAFEELDALEKP